MDFHLALRSIDEGPSQPDVSEHSSWNNIIIFAVSGANNPSRSKILKDSFNTERFVQGKLREYKVPLYQWLVLSLLSSNTICAN